MTIDKPGHEISNLLFHQGWITPVSLIIVLALVLHFLISRLYKRLMPRLEKTHLAWDFSLLKAVVLPLKFLIWILAITFGAEILGYHFENNTFVPFFRGVRSFAVIFLFLWMTLRFIKNMEIHHVREQREQKKQYDKTTVRAVCQVSRIGVILIALLVYLQTRNINISAVLAFGGAGGIVVGLAAKDLLANFFGGLMIYLDRPFNVGDWIRSPDREIEGFVETIGWRLTRIRTFSKRPLYVPNGIFSNISVENPSRMSNRQIRTRIGVRYNDAPKLGAIVAEVEEMLRNNPEIDTTMYLMVRFDEFGPSSLNFLVYCFTKTVKWAEYLLVQQKVFLKIIEIIEKHGAECAFPTTTLHIPEGVHIHPQEPSMP
ncbi:mechanosensitive ion channel family protein [Simkania negevensis]|uniref:MscS family inner membrane protein ynaI n=1 Tax=Simkania negevensis (strain ATCC VR-1471 / DSM 27360 / Z) TaxID=331113 RepID=F8L754_SIMNZ|nr:mechanosensitive ion channel family protein [Simkania negevensis]CCB88569.1 mscS family inner membrane protein ynaI [Simkania negevensis Z]